MTKEDLSILLVDGSILVQLFTPLSLPTMCRNLSLVGILSVSPLGFPPPVSVRYFSISSPLSTCGILDSLISAHPEPCDFRGD